MRYLKPLGLCLASMFVLCAAWAGSAAAASPLWLDCIYRGPFNGGYNDPQCLGPGGSHAYRSVGLEAGETITVKLSALSLRLVDTETFTGKSVIKCNGAGSVGEGLAEGPGKGVVKVAEVTEPKKNCERVEGPCKAGEVEEVKGANLPWKTEILETESKLFTKILADGSGEPGWKVKCNTMLKSEEDVCTSVSAEKAELLELSDEKVNGVLLVKGRLLDRIKGICTQSKKETGESSGSIAVSLPTGLALAIVKS